MGLIDEIAAFQQQVENQMTNAGQGMYDFGNFAKRHIWDIPIDFWGGMISDSRMPDILDLLGTRQMEDVQEARLRQMGLID